MKIYRVVRKPTNKLKQNTTTNTSTITTITTTTTTCFSFQSYFAKLDKKTLQFLITDATYESKTVGGIYHFHHATLNFNI